MIIKVNLTQAEIAVCKVLGNLRSIAARSASVKDVQMGSNNPMDIDEDGVIGEYAFCKYWNIFFDPSASPRSGSADCTLDGHRFDIKATRYKTGRLMATLKPNPDVDFYALAIIDGDDVIFPGFVSNAELRQDKNIKNLGHGDGYVMEQSELKQWKDR